MNSLDDRLEQLEKEMPQYALLLALLREFNGMSYLREHDPSHVLGEIITQAESLRGVLYKRLAVVRGIRTEIRRKHNDAAAQLAAADKMRANAELMHAEARAAAHNPDNALRRKELESLRRQLLVMQAENVHVATRASAWEGRARRLAEILGRRFGELEEAKAIMEDE